MPYRVVRQDRRWRVINDNTNTIAINPQTGGASDGGGHDTRAGAMRQATAMNIQKVRQEGDGTSSHS